MSRDRVYYVIDCVQLLDFEYCKAVSFFYGAAIMGMGALIPAVAFSEDMPSLLWLLPSAAFALFVRIFYSDLRQHYRVIDAIYNGPDPFTRVGVLTVTSIKSENGGTGRAPNANLFETVSGGVTEDEIVSHRIVEVWGGGGKGKEQNDE